MIENRRASSALYRDIAILTGLLALYGALCWYIDSNMGLFRGDPDYQYLMAGLDILSAKAPNYNDHPGTPAQSLIALGCVVMWLVTWPLHPSSSVVDTVLVHSQLFLACLSAMFEAIIAAALAFFVWSFRATLGALLPAVLGVFFAFMSAAIWASFHQVSAEPMLVAGTFLLVGVMLRQLHAPEGSVVATRWAVGVGMAAAFCVTVKVTAAPVLICLLFLKGRVRWTAGAACALSGLFFLIPVLPRARQILGNYLHIMTHNGDYGTGGAGAPSGQVLGANIVQLWQGTPEIFLALMLAIVVLMASRFLTIKAPLPRLLACSATIILFSILLVAKQPRPYYLISALAFVSLTVAIAAFLIARKLPFSGFAMWALAILLCERAVAAQMPYIKSEAKDWAADKLVLDRAAHNGCLVVPYYFADLPQWDLYFGNLYTNQNEFKQRLASLYPNFVTYNGGPHRFETYTTVLTPEDAVARFAREKCVYMLGLPWQAQFGIRPEALTLVAQSVGGVSLYTLNRGWEQP